MNCTEARQHWNLYHDSEGDADLHFRISEHLAMCPDCTHWFAQQSHLESLLAARLASQPATPAVWQRVRQRCGLQQPAVAPTRWWVLPAAAGALAAVAVLAYVLFLSPRRAPDLATLLAQWHQRLVAGEETPQFSSQSDLEVEAYLKQRVTFPVRCPPRKDAGFAVRGAGVFRLADQPAAYLAGEVGATPVSIFVLPSQSLDRFPRQREAIDQRNWFGCREGPYELVMAVIDRNAVLVIGSTDRAQLDRVLHAYGTYPHQN